MRRESLRGQPGMRAAEWTILALCVVAAVVPFVTGNLSPERGAFHAGTAPAFIIAVLTLVHVWARRSGVLWSSRYLALFSAVLALWMAISGFVLREDAMYAWSILVVGALLVIATVYEAWVSSPSREGMRPLDPRTDV